jgi:hypothetical protein
VHITQADGVTGFASIETALFRQDHPIIEAERVDYSGARLVEGLREAAGKDRIWVAIRCSPFHTASAFHPIIEHLKRVFGWQPENTAQQHLAHHRRHQAGLHILAFGQLKDLWSRAAGLGVL